jgi:hypothetical protein
VHAHALLSVECLPLHGARREAHAGGRRRRGSGAHAVNEVEDACEPPLGETGSDDVLRRCVASVCCAGQCDEHTGKVISEEEIVRQMKAGERGAGGRNQGGGA